MIVLENIATGETEEIKSNKGSLKPGWRVKAFVPEQHFEHTAKLAVLATKFGIPVPQFLDAARWLLKKNCPFCQLGTQVLKRIDELGEERATEAIAQILEAKDRNDGEALERIRKSLCLDQLELPPQS